MAYVKKANRVPETPVEATTAPKPEVVVPKIRVKRDWSNKDPFVVSAEIKKKYPGMAFAWVLRTTEKMELYEGNGWAYPHLMKDERKLDRPGGFETTFITKGDTVLMMLPQEDYDDMEEQRTSDVQRRLKAMSGTAGLRDQAKGVHDTAIMQEKVETEMKNRL